MGTIIILREIRKFPLQKWFHNHFVINSVSFKDGLKFHDSRAFYKVLKDTSDRICEEHGLSVIKDPKGKGVSKNLLIMEQAGMPTRYNVAREALDDAISKACNLQEVKANLKANGFQCQFASNRKYWTITLPGWKKPIRTYKLGDEYSRERIEERVYSNNMGARILRRREMYKSSPQYSFKRRIDKIMGRSGIEKLYLRYCYELGYLPKYNQNPNKVHSLLKDELLKCEMYSREAKLLADASIICNEDLISYKNMCQADMNALEKSRDDLRLKVKRKNPEEERSFCKRQITEISEEMKELRHKLKLIEDIEKRSEDMNEKLKAIDKNKEIEVIR